MKFQRTPTKSDYVIICEHPVEKLSDRYYQVITSENDVFSLHKNYVKEIFGKKKDFLSDYDDESSHIIFHISWITRKDPVNPKYYKTTITEWSFYEGDEDED